MDDDDEWLPTKLEKQVALLEASYPEVGFVYCWSDIVVDESGGSMEKGERGIIDGDITEYALSWQAPSSFPTMLLRSSVFQTIGGFNEDMRFAEDQEMMCRVGLHYFGAVIPEALVMIYKRMDHPRITDSKVEYRSHRIEFLEIHMDKFSEELAMRPVAKARVMSELANLEMSLSHPYKAFRRLLSAIRLNPRYSDIIRYVCSILKAFVWYATPLSNFRVRAKIILRKLRLR